MHFKSANPTSILFQTVTFTPTPQLFISLQTLVALQLQEVDIHVANYVKWKGLHLPAGLQTQTQDTIWNSVARTAKF